MAWGRRSGIWAWLGDREPSFLVAGVVLVFHVALSGRYGFHRDELYYVTAGRHPAAGYVDQPPFVPLLARGVTAVFGERLWPLRTLAGFGHAVLVVIAGRLAREFGGGRWAVGIAALATAVAPVFVATGGMFQTVVFDQLWWALALLLVVRLQGGADPRLWLVVGAVVGLGLETKWTMALLGIGLVVGYAAVADGRSVLRSPLPWLGVAVALVLWLPNLVWQAANDWPTLEFTRNNNAIVRAEEGRIGLVAEQLLLPGPVAVPLAIAGLVWCWRRSRWRALAFAVVTVFAVLLVVGGKAYYLAPFFVLLFAAGAVAAESWATRATAGGRRRLVPVAVALGGLLALPVVAPVAPETTYVTHLHDVNDETGEQLGWPELADQVASVYRGLPARERHRARIVTASYGEAAALDVYGPERGVPRGTVLSAHNSYVDWWPDLEPVDVVIGVRYERVTLLRYFGSVERVATIETPWDVPNEIAGTPITVCRDLRMTPDALREALRDFR